MAMNKKTRTATETLGFVGLVAGILILLNVLGLFFDFGRLDTTANRMFSLADGSRRLAASLEDDMEITAYFTEDLPAPFNATARQVRDLLSEYAAASGGRIRVRFVNPDDEELQQEAQQEGIRPVAHQKIENDSVSVVEGYRGLVIHYLDHKKTLPVISSSDGLEYTITMAIKEMVGEKTRVGVLGGHGSPSLSEGLTTLVASLPTYELVEVDASQEIDPDLAALLVVGPTDTLSETELRRIDQFVMRGGSLGVFGGGNDVDLSGGQPSGTPVDSGLDGLLGPWGVRIDQDIVADLQCERAPYRTPMGIPVPVAYPALPVVTVTPEQAEHPVLFRLPATTLPFISSLTVGDAPEGADVRVLARSSENSWKIAGPTMDLQIRPSVREWNPRPPFGPFPLIAAIEGHLPTAFPTASAEAGQDIDTPPRSEDEVRVLIVGSSTFFRDELMPRGAQGGTPEMNEALALILNTVDWLAADSDLIAIRAKGVDEAPLEVPTAVLSAEDEARQAMEEQDEAGVEEALEERRAAIAAWDAKKSMYRWLNGIGIPVAFALLGLLRWRRRNDRKKTLTL